MKFNYYVNQFIHRFFSPWIVFFCIIQVDDVDEGLLTQLAYNARGDICPMQGVIGGITAQEVMKV